MIKLIRLPLGINEIGIILQDDYERTIRTALKYLEDDINPDTHAIEVITNFLKNETLMNYGDMLIDKEVLKVLLDITTDDFGILTRTHILAFNDSRTMRFCVPGQGYVLMVDSIDYRF